MSGTKAGWTKERRRKQARRMRKRMRDPVKRAAAVERLREANARPGVREAKSARMKRLNNRMSTDDRLKAKCAAGQRKARREPAYVAMQSLVMADLMARPEMKAKARAHVRKMNRDPQMRAKQWEGRRRKAMPPDCPVSDLK